MEEAKKRNVLMPWLIGLAIVVAADLWIAYQMFATACQAPGFVQAIVVVLMPTVYLVLMYLTFKSQK